MVAVINKSGSFEGRMMPLLESITRRFDIASRQP